MFSGGGVFSEPAGEGGEVTHVASHELTWQHAGIDRLQANIQANTMSTGACK